MSTITYQTSILPLHEHILHDSAAALYNTLDLSAVFDRILDSVGRIVRYDTASIMLIADGTARVVSSRGYPDDVRLPTGLTLAASAHLRQMIETKRALVISDTQQASDWVTLRGAYSDRSYVGAPLYSRGETVGFINLYSSTPGFFGSTDADHLQLFADHAAVALANAQMLISTEQRASEMAALYEVSQHLVMQYDLKGLLRTILDHAASLLKVSYGVIYMVDPQQGDLELAIARGHTLSIGAHLSFGSGVGGRVAQSRQPLIVNDYPHWEHRMDSRFASPQTRAVAGVPMIYADELIGVLTLSETSARQFTEADIRLLSLFATQAASAVHNTRLFEKVRQGRDQLRSLTQRLLETQEDERAWLAHELHDEIGQQLTALGLLLDRGAPAQIAEARTLVHELTAQVRNISLDLRPPNLDERGLWRALDNLLVRYSARTNIRVDYKRHIPESVGLSKAVTIAAYRIVQEALTNVARHAAVSRVTVRAWFKTDMLYLQIEDKGKGFNPELSASTGGLAGMRERAQLLGGRMDIVSKPDGGTTVFAELPLTDRAARRSTDDLNSAGR